MLVELQLNLREHGALAQQLGGSAAAGVRRARGLRSRTAAIGNRVVDEIRQFLPQSLAIGIDDDGSGNVDVQVDACGLGGVFV